MKKDKIKVAILGGTGFVGRNVREVLEKHGFEVGIFSRTTGCDLLDLSVAWSKLDQFRPNYIINCAALVGSVNYVSDFAADVVDINMRIILNVYKIAQQMREVLIINPIANCAYPGVMDMYEENHLWDGPLHPSVMSYGSTRRMMIVLSRCYSSQYGVRSVNLIVPNIYGPFDSTNPNKTHALNALAIKFVQAKKTGAREIEVWGTGKPIREWLFVRDFAEVVRRVVEGHVDLPEPINIGQNKGYSVTEIVDYLIKLLHYKGKIIYNTRFQDGAPKKVMDDRYFRQKFPDFKFIKFSDGLKDTIKYYQTIL
jgi:GDP-L-fucose synthase